MVSVLERLPHRQPLPPVLRTSSSCEEWIRAETLLGFCRCCPSQAQQDQDQTLPRGDGAASEQQQQQQQQEQEGLSGAVQGSGNCGEEKGFETEAA